MTQQYQHIEAAAGVVMLKSTPRLLEIIKAAHERIGLSDVEVMTKRHFELAKRRVNEAQMVVGGKHALLMPPYVKGSR